jgi:hypothetical protein
MQPLAREIHQHMHFVATRAEAGHGRTAELTAIHHYLQQPNSEGRLPPFLLHGSPGSGKSSIMAMAFASMSAQQAPAQRKALHMIRCCGLTPLTSSMFGLLESLNRQLAVNLSYRVASDARLPARDSNVYDAFRFWLQQAHEEQPLVIFIDALDVVASESTLRWLPPVLPRYVHLVLSVASTTTSEKLLQALQDRLNGGPGKADAEAAHVLQISFLNQDTADSLLSAALAIHQRCLATSQRDAILAAFKQHPSALHLQLLISKALQLRSDEVIPLSSNEGASLHAAIEAEFSRAERFFGPVLVQHTLGLLVLARHGLSVQELEDLLSCDDEVLDSVFVFWTPPLRRIPPLLVTRLLHALQSILVNSENFRCPASRSAACLWQHSQRTVPLLQVPAPSRTECVRWAHGQFASAAALRYTQRDDAAALFHRLIADYFLGRWEKTPKPHAMGTDLRHVSAQPVLWPSANGGNLANQRKLDELPWQLVKLGQFQVYRNTCCLDAEWLEAKCIASSLAAQVTEMSSILEGTWSPLASAPPIDSGTAQVLTSLRDVFNLFLHDVQPHMASFSAQLLTHIESRENLLPDIQSLYDSAAIFGETHLSLLPCQAFSSAPGGTCLGATNGQPQHRVRDVMQLVIFRDVAVAAFLSYRRANAEVLQAPRRAGDICYLLSHLRRHHLLRVKASLPASSRSFSPACTDSPTRKVSLVLPAVHEGGVAASFVRPAPACLP